MCYYELCFLDFFCYTRKMSLNIKDVENLAELAKIELSLEEKEKLLKDMEGILDYVKQVSEVKSEDIEADDGNRNVWREDEKKEMSFDKDLILNQFPDRKGDFLKTKKIL